MDQALAAEDWDAAERLMVPAAAQAINQGQYATLNRWLEALPQARLQGSSELAALKGWGLLRLGQFDAAETWADLAHGLLPADAQPSSQAFVVCLRTYLAQVRNDVSQVIELAHRALTFLEEEDPLGLRGAALSSLASAQMTMDDIPAAIQTYRELVRLGRETGHAISAVSALANLAWLLHVQGDPCEAIALCHQGLDDCVNALGRPVPPRPTDGETPLAGPVHVALGLIYYDLNELARAREHLIRGLELGKPLGPSTGRTQAAFTLARIEQLLGEEEAARATVRDVCQAASKLNIAQVNVLLAALEADFELKLGNMEAAARWAETAGLAPTDSPGFLRETEYFTYARLLIARNRPAEAQTLLAGLERLAQSNGLRKSLITIHILEALSEQARGQKTQALARLVEALRLAAPEGYVRAVLDEGEAVLGLLPSVRHVAPQFVDLLLGDAPAELSGDKSAPRGQPLIEPLSERELEVLGHMAEGLSNREIAGKLFISVGTVKTHVHNICAKLAVRSRTQAAAQARALGLL
jgi:LuxR family maltose regulon positive regulatory protein